MPEIAKVRYTHDAVIDEIIASPAISQRELAAKFGYTQSWLSIIVNSDAFKERLEQRKKEIVDPVVLASVRERMDGLASRAIDRLMEKLDNGTPISVKELTGIISVSAPARSLTPPAPPNQTNFVVHLPAPASNSREWLLSSSRPPPPVPEVIENGEGS